MDVVSDYSKPLVNYMMCELLGLPQADRSRFIECCDQLRTFVTAARMSNETVLKAKEAVKSFEAIRDYIRTMIAARRENFADDVIGHSFALEPNEEPLTEDEVLANCVFPSCRSMEHVCFYHECCVSACCAIRNNSLVSAKVPSRLLSPSRAVTLRVSNSSGRSAVFQRR